jgi:predicted ATPase/class 3 adenylate cyclase/DNA-binding CsgD family transcriptional regulator
MTEARHPLVAENLVSEAADASTFLLPTGTVTFLLTDVEHSTASWEAAPEAMAKAISRHYEILADAVGSHRGVRPVEQGEGDSIVAAFSRGVDAVAAALSAQQLLAQETWPEGGDLRVRMALHTGDAQLRDAFNYYGPTVIRTARLRALAHGGQTIASRATRDLVAEGLPHGASWRDLGSHRLKDLGRPEHVFQLCHVELPDTFPALAGLDSTRNNLPAQLTTFVGRERELAEAGALIDEHRLVTLTGSGGCGKTRLALQPAAERTDRFPSGVWYVELATLAGSGTVARQVADVLRVPEDPERSLLDVLAQRLTDDRVLLVLDNCEHLLDDCAVLVDTLSRQSADLAIIATSRQPLDVPGEVVWRVPSMTVPAHAASDALEAVGACDAVRLFCDRAARGRPGFALSAGNAGAIATICDRVDGIPLAIELAAARVRTMALEEIVEGLDNRFHLLTGGSRTLVPRQQTLEASVDWSYDLLTEHEQRVFVALSVFSAPFTAEAAAAVSGTDPVATRDSLAALVDRSLIQLDDDRVPARYRYLETVKAYGRARLREGGDDESTRDRHLGYFLDAAERSQDGLIGHEEGLWLGRFDLEHDDMRTALEWASATFAQDDLLRLVSALGPYWHTRGHSREAQAWFDRALAEGETAKHELRARVLWASAYQAIYTQDVEFGIGRAEAALELAERGGDLRTIARCTDSLATLQQYADPAGAQPTLLEAAALAKAQGDIWCQIDCLQKAAYSDYYRDRWPEAIEGSIEVERLASSIGNRLFLSYNDLLLGTAAWRQGRFEEARRPLREALDHALELGEPMTIASPATVLYWIEIQSRNSEAAQGIRAEVQDALGDKLADSMVGGLLACVEALTLLDAGDPETAAAMLSAVCEGLLNDRVLFPTSLFMPLLSLAQMSAGDHREAQHTIDRLRGIADDLQSTAAAADADRVAAVLARREGRPDLAGPLARSALTGYLEIGLQVHASETLELLGGILVELGNAAGGLRLLAAAAQIATDNGWGPTWGVSVLTGGADIAAARDALGDRASDIEAEGAALTLEQAAELAMRAHGTRKRPASGWASLSPTELEVVALVAEGKTNPEIASALTISRATVKTHVSHVLTKLGLGSRSEIAAEFARRRSLG